MVVILFVLTVLGCIAVDVYLTRREKRQAAAKAPGHRESAWVLPSLAAQELPGGLFFHSGHTWAKIEPSGTV